MTIINYFAELLTTFIEIFVLLCVFDFFFFKRYKQQKHVFFSIVLSVLLTIITLWLNSIQLFSVPTAYLWIVLVSLFGWILYKDNLLKILTVSIIYILLVGSFDFFCFSVMEFLLGFEGITFTLNSEIGWFRTIYILAVKLILICLYFISKSIVKDKKYAFGISSSVIMAIYGLFCLSCMQSLFEAATTNSITQMRKSVLLAWLFIMICAISIIVVLRNRSRLSMEKYENKLISKQIEILENDNKQLNNAYSEIAKLSHDYNNQIRTISTMAAETDNAELKAYLGDLIKDIDDIKVNIYTGIDSIDAVINRKEKQANAQGILTTISASYNSDICIRNIDVCVILANLFDNAIEACEKVDEVQQRFINFNISSVGTMVVIKIENSYNYELSIKLNDGVLATTKTAIDTHGYGLKIVNSIVEKYDGVLETTYDDNKFSVYVLINDK